MLFRPEDVHGASGISHILKPFPEGNRHVGHVSRGFLIQEFSILELDAKRLSAIEARKIHGYFLAGKEPADRQRFKASLTEPLLAAVDGYAILRRQVVEGCEGYNVVCSRV